VVRAQPLRGSFYFFRSAFSGCPSLTRVTVPDTATIGAHAFPPARRERRRSVPNVSPAVPNVSPAVPNRKVVLHALVPT